METKADIIRHILTESHPTGFPMDCPEASRFTNPGVEGNWARPGSEDGRLDVYYAPDVPRLVTVLTLKRLTKRRLLSIKASLDSWNALHSRDEVLDRCVGHLNGDRPDKRHTQHIQSAEYDPAIRRLTLRVTDPEGEMDDKVKAYAPNDLNLLSAMNSQGMDFIAWYLFTEMFRHGVRLWQIMFHRQED